MSTDFDNENDEPYPVDDQTPQIEGEDAQVEQPIVPESSESPDLPADLAPEDGPEADIGEPGEPDESSQEETPVELLSEIRETLVQEDQVGKKKAGLFAWLGGLFKRKEQPVLPEPAQPTFVPAETEPVDEDEAPEMMGAFPVYRLQEPEYYELEEASGSEEQEVDREVEPGLAEELGEEEPTGVEEIPALVSPDENILTETDTTTATQEEDTEWKNIFSRLLKRSEKENEPDLDDAGLEDRLQRSMSDDTDKGVSAWLASLREQEENEGSGDEPAFSRDWLAEESEEVEEAPEQTQTLYPSLDESDELGSLRNQIFDQDEETLETVSTLPDASSTEVEDESEVPVDERLVAFRDPFTDQTRDLHFPTDDFTTRMELTEKYTEGSEEFVEVPQTVFSPSHPEIFEPDEEEKTVQGVDLRNVALEDYEAPPSTGEVINPEKPETALERFAIWVSDRSRMQRASLYVMFLLIFAGIVLAAALALRTFIPALAVPSSAAPAAPAAAVPGGAPYPLRLIMTGGWPFDLNRGSVQNGQWDPQGSEWLEGTELRRVVGLRYNAQLEAVANSLKKGDEISLVMSNADTILYKVEEIKTVPVGDTSIFIGTRPSLVIVLFDQKASERRVIFCGQ